MVLVLLELWDTLVPITKSLRDVARDVVGGLGLPLNPDRLVDELLAVLGEGGKRRLVDAVKDAVVRASRSSGASLSPRTTLLAARSVLSRIASLEPMELVAELPGVDVVLFTTLDEDVAELIARRAMVRFRGIIGPSSHGLKPSDGYYMEALRLGGVVVSGYVADLIGCSKFGVPMIYINRDGMVPSSNLLAVVGSVSEAIRIVSTRLP